MANNRSSNTSSGDVRVRHGSHSLGGKKHGLGWLPWLILGLLLLLALGIWALVRNVDDDDSGEPSPTVATSPATVAVGDGAATATVLPTGTTGQPAGVTPTTASTDTPSTSVESPSTAASSPATASRSGVTAPTPTTVRSSATTVARSATTAAAPSATTAAASPGNTGGGSGAAPLVAGTEDLVAVSSSPASVGALTGQPVSGTATVQSVVADEGFWVGSSTQNRVFVILSPQARGTSGESPFQVVAGQTVEIVGTMTATGDRIPADVTEADGLSQLRAQGAFVEASSLKLIS